MAEGVNLEETVFPSLSRRHVTRKFYKNNYLLKPPTTVIFPNLTSFSQPIIDILQQPLSSGVTGENLGKPLKNIFKYYLVKLYSRCRSTDYTVGWSRRDSLKIKIKLRSPRKSNASLKNNVPVPDWHGFFFRSNNLFFFSGLLSYSRWDTHSYLLQKKERSKPIVFLANSEFLTCSFQDFGTRKILLFLKAGNRICTHLYPAYGVTHWTFLIRTRPK